MTSAIVLRSQFDELVEQTLKTVKASSARVYQQTYNLWVDYCNNTATDFLDFRPATVTRFLEAQHVTAATRKRQFSAMRKLARMWWILTGDDHAGRIYTALKEVKPTDINIVDSNRSRHALNPTQAHAVLAVWNGDNLLSLRNRALITFIAMTGVRRAEAAVLRWSDINFEDGIATVLGKRDKVREVAIVGEIAIDALLKWREALPDREYVFPPFDERQQPDGDKPIDGQTVFRIVKRTEKLSGVKFSPHTLRRTFITEALAQGTPIADVKAQAGHETEAVTLRYARPVEAKQRRSRFKLRYGDTL